MHYKHDYTYIVHRFVKVDIAHARPGAVASRCAGAFDCATPCAGLSLMVQLAHLRTIWYNTDGADTARYLDF